MKLLIVLALLVPSLAFAQAGFKCVDQNGRITYSEFGCTGNQSQLYKFDANPKDAGWAAHRNGLYWAAIQRGDLNGAQSLALNRDQRENAHIYINQYQQQRAAQYQAAMAQRAAQEAAAAQAQATAQAQAQQAAREQALINAANNAAAAAQQAAAQNRNTVMSCTINDGSGTCVPVQLKPRFER